MKYEQCSLNYILTNKINQITMIEGGLFYILLFFHSILLQAYRLGLNQNYQYYNDQEIVNFVEMEQYIFGVWFKYQPLIGIPQVGMIAASESNSSLLFYQKVKETSELYQLSYITINYDGKNVLLQVRLKLMDQLLIHDFSLDPNNFDGIWNYHYYYFQKNFDSFTITIGYINSQFSDYQQFYNLQCPEYQAYDIIYGGGLKVIFPFHQMYDPKFDENFYLTYFLGILDISTSQKSGTPQNVFNGDNYFDYEAPFFQLVAIETHLDDSHYVTVNSDENIPSIYKINFWVQLNGYQNEGILYIFHISAVLAKNYKEKIGGNVLYLYYQNSLSNQYSLILGYYSFDFPYVSFSQDIYKKELQLDYTFAEKQWYYVAIQYYEKTISLMIINVDQNTQFAFTIDNVNQFTMPMFYIYLGGDIVTKSTLSGTIATFQLTTGFSSDQISQVICHFSCLTCNGPYSFQCLTCSDKSGREFTSGQCNCKIQYLEQYQKNCYDFSDQKLIEIEKKTEEIICTYGKFLYQEECFEWYYQFSFISPSASQGYVIYCTECIVNWRNWVYNPLCTYTIQSDNDYEKTYYQSDAMPQYFTFDQGVLNLCFQCELCLNQQYIKGCQIYKYLHLSKQILIRCVNAQYSKETLDCIWNTFLDWSDEQNCGKYCGACETNGQCYYCENPSKYYLSSDRLNCKECQIRFCKYCFEVEIHNQFNVEFSTLAPFIRLHSLPLSDDIITYCALCYDGYTFNLDTGNCELQALPSNCKQAYIQKDTQLICLLTSSNTFHNTEVSISDCSSYITNCIQCIHDNNYRLFCMICQSGYYVDTSIGICRSCYEIYNSEEVKECQYQNLFLQDQWIIEIEPFYNSFFIGQQIYLQNFGFRNYVNILECQKGYMLFEQECILIEQSATCAETGFANFQFYCSRCKATDGQEQYTYDPNNVFQCLTCPYQCKYCQPRANSEIQALNPVFKINSTNSKYTNYCIKQFDQSSFTNQVSNSIYFDTQYMFITICSKWKKCELTLTFISQNKTQFRNINNDYLIRYMNMRKITIITGLYNFTGGSTLNLDFFSELYQVKQQVFSIKRVIAHIIGYHTIMYFYQQSIKGIDQLIFEQTTILIRLITAMEKYQTFIMNSENCIYLQVLSTTITISADSPLYSKNFAQIFQIFNLCQIDLQDVLIKNMHLQYDFFEFYTQKTNGQIILENLVFQNVTFNQSTFIQLTTENQVSSIRLQNISLINCTIENGSGLISFQKNFQFTGNIFISNITIVNTLFLANSSLFYFPSSSYIHIEGLILKQVSLINSNLLKFCSCDILEIENFKVINISLSKSSLIFVNGNTFMTLTNLKFSEIKISSFAPLMNVENSENSNIQFVGLEQEFITQIQDYIYDNTSPCLYQFTGNSITLKIMNIVKAHYLKDFCLHSFTKIDISNVEIIGISNISAILLPTIHCLSFDFYHNSFLQIVNFENVNVFNLTSSNLFFVNSSLFYLSRELTQKDQSVIFSNIILQNNLILKININLISSIIYIYSQSQLQVNLSYLKLTNNWINHYIIDLQVISPGLIYVVANEITFISSELKSNVITNSSDSLIFFNAHQIEIKNIESNNMQFPKELLFSPTFIQEKEILYKLFPLQSRGGLFYLICQICILNSCIIQNQVAAEGGALIIRPQQEGVIDIMNNAFFNTSAKSLTNLQGIGGCIYLDASSSAIIMHFINNTISISNSKYLGGAIFIQPSKVSNYFEFFQTKFIDIFSLQGSLLYCVFPDESLNNSIIFRDTTISIMYSYFKEFITNQQFSDQDNKFWLMSTGGIHIINSIIIIDDLHFTGYAFQPMFFFQFSNSLILLQISMINVSQVSPALIIIQQHTPLLSVSKLSENIFQLDGLKLINILIFNREQSDCYLSDITTLIVNFCALQPMVVLIRDNYDSDCQVQSIEALISSNDKYLILISNVQGQQKNKLSNIDLSFIQCFHCRNGIFSITTSIINFDFILMNNNQCGTNGCLSFTQDSSQLESTFNICRSIFYNNSAEYGGAIFASYVNLHFYSSQIFNNSANYGGGIFFISNGNQFVSKQTFIFNNLAQKGSGGAYLQNYSVTNLNQIGFIVFFNKVTTGVENLFSKISYLTLIIYGTESKNLKINKQIEFASVNQAQFIQIPSGQFLKTYSLFNNQKQQFITKAIFPRLLAYNQLGEQLKGLNGTQCSINQSVGDINTFLDTSFLLQQVQFDQLNHYFDLSDLMITFNPYEKKKDRGIQIQIQCSDQIDENYTLYFNFRTYFCQPGEYFSDDACLQCDSTRGLYTVKANQSECQKMDTTSMKAITSSELDLFEGYWRQHKEIGVPAQCYKAKQNCLGGWATGDSTCSKGNIGALCEECDVYNTRGDGQYQKSTGQSCTICGEIYGIILKVVVITFWTLGSTWVTVQSANHSNELLQKLKMQTRYYEIVFKQNLDRAGSLIKMLTNYFQIILAIKTFQLSSIINIQNLLSPISDPTGTFSYSFDCYLAMNYSVPIIYGRVVWMIVLTIIYFLIFLACTKIYSMLTNQQLKKSTITTSILYLFTFTQPSLINELASLMAVRTISGISYIKGNPAYHYNTEEHFNWMLIMIFPIVVIYAFLIPGWIFYKLAMKKKMLNLQRMREIWGYLFYEYRKENYFWEIIKIIQREIIIIIVNYLDEDVTIKAILICFIVFTYNKLIHSRLPYCLDFLNSFEKHYIFLCAIIIMLGNLLYQIQLQNIIPLEWLLQFLIIALIFHLFVNILLQITKSYIVKYDDKLDLVRSFILQTFPNILNYCPILTHILQFSKNRRQLIEIRFARIQKFLKHEINLKKSFKEFQKKNSKEFEQESNFQLINNASNEIMKRRLSSQHQQSCQFTQKTNEDAQQFNSIKQSQDYLLETQNRNL